ncbi:MAG: flavodoxin-dependent (E)-4-hydroxy-3-methylbut-2-enyl-diphosphate synthase [Syntrophaceae bacterium]|nr:flavodoxin-dependent (E)-4-hydroxy-3-methylbut-2-enyl-diphosphate synthase [Syntrophaceae bacterium]
MQVRKATRAVHVGTIPVGGGAPVVVQSMTATDTRDVAATSEQIRRLAEAGCEIARVAVPDREAASVLSEIQKASPIPVIADIHFDDRLALMAIEQGMDGIRINPGNIPREKFKGIVLAAKERDVCIRLGINGGSLEKDLLQKYGGPTALALVESALRSVDYLEGLGFSNLKVSLKSSDVPVMIDAYREFSKKCDYPLHLGVTEAGTVLQSAIKSSIGIGVLLAEGIGDTIRVSVTGDPVQEMTVAWGILRALKLRERGPEIISCPTCGRCEIDLLALVEEAERRLTHLKTPLKIALMGCVVNGPGEASEADIGIAGGKGVGMLFKKGQMVRKLREEEFIPVLLAEIKKITGEKVDS